MKKRLLLLITISLYSHFAYASIKVMTFNTMCKICDRKKEYGPFEQRVSAMADTINRHSPDLISLQELQSPQHMMNLKKLLKENYIELYKHHTLWPATDTVLLIKNARYEIIESSGAWLGPRAPKFSFGWKIRTPRRFSWASLKDRQTGFEFIFSGSHFDAGSNRTPSAKYSHDFFNQQTLPVIFAGDTNIVPSEEGYSYLRKADMLDTFLESKSFSLIANGASNINDACTAGDTKPWPTCRIDHILYSANSPWSTKSFSVDLFRYYKMEQFVSDHRAVIVELESLN